MSFCIYRSSLFLIDLTALHILINNRIDNAKSVPISLRASTGMTSNQRTTTNISTCIQYTCF